MQGKPTVRRFRYIDVDAEQNPPKEEPKENYVTSAQFDELLDKFNELKQEFDKMKKSQPKEDKAK